MGLLIAVAAVVGVIVLAATILYAAGARKAAPVAQELTSLLSQADKTRAACVAVAKARHEADRERITEEYNRTCRELQEQWDQAEEMEMDVARNARQGLEAKLPRATARNERLLRLKLDRLPPQRDARLAQAREAAQTKREQLEAERTKWQTEW